MLGQSWTIFIMNNVCIIVFLIRSAHIESNLCKFCQTASAKLVRMLGSWPNLGGLVKGNLARNLFVHMLHIVSSDTVAKVHLILWTSALDPVELTSRNGFEIGRMADHLTINHLLNINNNVDS